MGRGRTDRLWIGVALAIGLSGAPALARVRIGETVAVTIASPASASAAGRHRVWTHTLQHPGAAFLRLHVARLRLGPTDELRVLDGEGQAIAVYSGESRPRSGFWTAVADGDRVTLELHAPGGTATAAVVIDRYGHGPTGIAAAAQAGTGIESVCGVDETEDVACYAGTAIEAASRAVALLTFVENGFHFACTGFLISSQDHLLTNEHCLRTQEAVESLEARFGYRARACGGVHARPGRRFAGDRLLVTDHETDLALLTLRGRPSRAYGFLALADRELDAGEPLHLPQHPGGGVARVSVAGCQVATPVTDGRGPGTDFGHRCDTDAGSSGAPVLDLSDRVVGLHHVGGCGGAGENRAVLMSRIVPRLPPIETVLSLERGTVIPGAGPGHGRLRLRGRVSLGRLSAGIDPLAEPFTLTLADADGPFYTAALPPGTFRVNAAGDFVFTDPDGTLASGLRRVRLQPDGPGSLIVIAEGWRLDARGADRGAITIGIAIGDEVARGAFAFRRRDRRWIFP
jgi:hypothetical protein